jgi:hypothetical protein
MIVAGTSLLKVPKLAFRQSSHLPTLHVHMQNCLIVNMQSHTFIKSAGGDLVTI